MLRYCVINVLFKNYLNLKRNICLRYIQNSFRRSCDMSIVKCLAAFDFDKTILLDNTDSAVRNLLPKEIVPKYNHEGWTLYMQTIFKLLHKNNIPESEIEKSIIQISPVDGMCELIKELSENLNFDIIIISDSNSYFINAWLNEKGLLRNVKKVFTNPAKFVGGLLEIQMYHIQNWCALSEKNMCKGQILEDFINEQKMLGVSYEKVVYVGDGENDFCPMLRLNPKDKAFCRKGYKCEELIKLAQANRPICDRIYKVKANVNVWCTGFDILNAIRDI